MPHCSNFLILRVASSPHRLFRAGSTIALPPVVATVVVVVYMIVLGCIVARRKQHDTA
ncbi:MAG: hypothetical protein AVDCRST_MAG93-7879 [uncultured Chloroflexia bacterium]|uniref:Uncharacterized protein n=1 Tax=uncultured Chloroflexia bacterium TaxID=1672391 RepID=A0A6J4MUA4_9CHLR|nr:MAG: hypothetical protein AVDCRST_MAG93-7879 [uncultured Chloroflexia bacterium]